MRMNNGNTIINGEVVIKPYYYMRNGLLHVRYTVDRVVELSKAEEETLKKEVTAHPERKQEVLSKHWNLLTEMIGKPILSDGVRVAVKKYNRMTKEYKNGHES